MTRFRVLFVDDEPNILSGMQRMLHPMRDRLDVRTAEGGEAALTMLAAEPFDAIVADVRMPGMGGAELLETVRQRYPLLIRFALSGQSDEVASLQLTGIAHQYLAKPCSPDTLREAITSSIALSAALRSRAVQAVLNRSRSLPSVPQLCLEIDAELQSAEPSVQRVGAIVAQDPAMSAKVLQLVNSAFFGLPRRVNSAELATKLLGLETMRALVLSLHLFAQFRNPRIEGFSFERLWHHSVNAGTIGRALMVACRAPRADVEMTLVAGLLHDVGMMVLAENFPVVYGDVIAASSGPAHVPLCEAETASFGVNHAEVGGYLLGLWGLPVQIADAVARHHDPGADDISTLDLALGVHVAASLSRVGDDAAVENESIAPSLRTAPGFGSRFEEWSKIGQTSAGVSDSGRTHTLG